MTERYAVALTDSALAARVASRLDWPRGKLEVLVSRGSSPAPQRNEAVRLARGEYVLFLDDDSVPPRDLLRRYASALGRWSRPAVLGGPAVCRPASRLEGIVHAVFSERWLTGRSASRYAPHGHERRSDERELILCNLLVSRQAFLDAGGFLEALYPNEENELLERMKRAGWNLVHCPQASVRRPQRSTIPGLLATAYRYGEGRGTQARSAGILGATRTRIALALAALTGVLAAGWGAAGGHAASLLPAVTYLVYLTALAARLARALGPVSGALAALLGAALHGVYTAGLVKGCLRPRWCRSAPVNVMALAGIRLAGSQSPSHPAAEPAEGTENEIPCA